MVEHCLFIPILNGNNLNYINKFSTLSNTIIQNAEYISRK